MPSRKIARALFFEGKQIRRVWDEKEEKWWFSIVDIIQALTESPNARSYWK